MNRAEALFTASSRRSTLAAPPAVPVSLENNANHMPTLRVIISCPEKKDAKKLVLLPASLRELLKVGAQKFGCSLNKVLTEEGAEIDDIEVIRDGDNLLLVSETGFRFKIARD